MSAPTTPRPGASPRCSGCGNTLVRQCNNVACARFAKRQPTNADVDIQRELAELSAKVTWYRDEIDRLAAVVMRDFPDEPGRTGESEGAVDVAIRLLGILKREHTAHQALVMP